VAPSLKAKKGTFKVRASGFGKEVGFETTRFVKAAESFINKLNLAGERVVRAWKGLVVETANEIQVRTPVDTGTARAAWRLNGSDPSGPTPEPSGSGDELRYRISNSVKYIIYLEYGWSKQAPTGMVRVTLRGFARRLRASAAKAVKGQ